MVILFISQLMNIGNIFESKNDYQTIVDSQKKYYRKYFINVVLDPEEDFAIVKGINLEEYIEDKKYEYGFGITTGSGALFSPSFNIKWNDIKDKKLFEKNIDDNKKVINFQKLQLMVKKTDYETNDQLVNTFISFIKDSEKVNKLRKEIVEELFKEFVIKENLGREQPMRVLFSFKIKTNDVEKNLFPGKLKGFKQWYIYLWEESISPPIKVKELCHACNSIKEIVGPFNTGIFTLDQNSFSIGFNGKNSGQFQVCRDCYISCLRGFNFVENKLNFYAYKFKKGRDDIRVYHYLIPVATNIEMLKKAIDEISQVKTELNNNKKLLIENKIKIRSEGAKKAEWKFKKELEAELNKLKNEKKRYEENTNISFDVNELLEKLHTIKLSFLDMYYIIADNKQNPSVKELIDVILIKKERIQFLANAIKKVKEEYELENTLRFNELYHLVGDRNFINILSQYLSGGKINTNRFEKFASKSIKQAFKDEYFKRETKSYFSKKIETFQVM